MKIRIRYDNQTMTLDVPEEDFTVMVQMLLIFNAWTVIPFPCRT